MYVLCNLVSRQKRLPRTALVRLIDQPGMLFRKSRNSAMVRPPVQNLNSLGPATLRTKTSTGLAHFLYGLKLDVWPANPGRVQSKKPMDYPQLNSNYELDSAFGIGVLIASLFHNFSA